jgi:hypothetical protein
LSYSYTFRNCLVWDKCVCPFLLPSFLFLVRLFPQWIELLLQKVHCEYSGRRLERAWGSLPLWQEVGSLVEPKETHCTSTRKDRFHLMFSVIWMKLNVGSHVHSWSLGFHSTNSSCFYF